MDKYCATMVAIWLFRSMSIVWSVNRRYDAIVFNLAEFPNNWNEPCILCSILAISCCLRSDNGRWISNFGLDWPVDWIQFEYYDKFNLKHNKFKYLPLATASKTKKIKFDALFILKFNYLLNQLNISPSMYSNWLMKFVFFELSNLINSNAEKQIYTFVHRDYDAMNFPIMSHVFDYTVYTISIQFVNSTISFVCVSQDFLVVDRFNFRLS